MGERQLTPHEVAEFHASHHGSKVLLEDIYTGALGWKVKMDETVREKLLEQIHEAREELIKEIDNYIPMYLNPTRQKRGRNLIYSPTESNPPFSFSPFKGGKRNTRRGRRRRSHSR